MSTTLMFAGAVQAEPDARSRLDRDNLTWMQSTHPAAAQKFIEGESLFAAGKPRADIERSAALFKAASDEAPEAWLPSRRLCQALAALGRHAEAVAACESTLQKSSDVLSFRAMVAALMSGPADPSPEEMGMAVLFAQRATELSPNTPWGYAASCDIARKIGDIEMFNECAARLEQVAPGHDETARVRTFEASLRPGFGLLSAWTALALVFIGTLLHAVRRAWRVGHPRRAGSLVALALLGALSAARSAHAEAAPPDFEARHALSKYPIDDRDPSSSVPTPKQRDEDPLNYGYFLMDLGYKAVEAAKHGDHTAAARFYEAAEKADPETATPFVKACEQYELQGDLRKAIDHCGAALSKQGAAITDYTHYARLVFARPGGIEPKDVADLDAVAAHLKGGPDVGHAAGLDIQCQLGARLEDQVRLAECAPLLGKLGPDDPKAIFFQWFLAMKRRDYGAAMSLVKHAKSVSRTSQRDAQVAELERSTIAAMPFWRKGFGFRDWRVGAAVTILLAVALTALLVRRGPHAKARSA
jgi:tetratricopeptide (TPR) repeat protein